MRLKPRILGATFCIILDIIAFIITSMFLLATENLWLVLLCGALIYVYAWDAYNATKYIVLNKMK